VQKWMVKFAYTQVRSSANQSWMLTPTRCGHNYLRNACYRRFRVKTNRAYLEDRARNLKVRRSLKRTMAGSEARITRDETFHTNYPRYGL
jgi:hypothetical protein